MTRKLLSPIFSRLQDFAEVDVRLLRGGPHEAHAENEFELAKVDFGSVGVVEFRTEDNRRNFDRVKIFDSEFQSTFGLFLLTLLNFCENLFAFFITGVRQLGKFFLNLLLSIKRLGCFAFGQGAGTFAASPTNRRANGRHR